MPTFRDTLSHLHRQVGDEWLNLRIVWVDNGRRFGSKIACANSKEGDGVGVGPVTQHRTYPLLHHPPYYWRRLFSSQAFSPWLPKLLSNLVIHHVPAHEDGTECSETSAYKIQTPGNYPKENIQHTEHGESLKSRIATVCFLPSLLLAFEIKCLSPCVTDPDLFNP